MKFLNFGNLLLWEAEGGGEKKSTVRLIWRRRYYDLIGKLYKQTFPDHEFLSWAQGPGPQGPGVEAVLRSKISIIQKFIFLKKSKIKNKCFLIF